MIVIMSSHSEEQLQKVVSKLEGQGFNTHLSRGVEKTIIGAVSSQRVADLSSIEIMPGVERVVRILQPYKLVGREFKTEGSIVKVGDLEIGGDKVVVIAGPCSVESYDQMHEAAVKVKQAGAVMIRGGAYKPRTSPYSFQGLEEEGLKILRRVSDEVGIPFVTEVIDPRTVELVADYSDMLQIGARNMQNFVLLREVAKSSRPVLLKRGPSATIEEWLMAAEYIMSGGNYNVVLCERGVRTYETYTRNTLDLSAIPAVKHLSHLPVIADPSHGTGRWRMVAPMSRAAVAAGADGLIIEVHPCPEEALSDGPQSLTPENFAALMGDLQTIAGAVGRRI